MKHFSRSRWADPEFSKEYRDNADIFIVERRRLFEIMKSFYRHFLSDKKKCILDLGCGDGIITCNLLELDNSITATLVDPSMAIHHLTTEEKKMLFEFIHSCLNPGGYFMNIDVMLAPADCLEDWYMRLWKEWMDEKRSAPGMEQGLFSDIPARYRETDDNKPDTLDVQLNALRHTGFKEVDCFYKYGIFTVYGGKKSLNDK